MSNLYIVRQVQKDKNNSKAGFQYGVFDTEHWSFPFEGPRLRAAGIKRLRWFDSEREAQGFADILNGTEPQDRIKDAPTSNEDDGLAAMAEALLSDAQ